MENFAIIAILILEGMFEELIHKIDSAWENRALLQQSDTTQAIRDVIALLDRGEVRVSER